MALSWTIATYVSRAARECSITPPASWTDATSTTEVQFRSYLNDVVDELLERHDWNQLTLDQTISGDGSTAYDLASDFLRLSQGHDGLAVYETSPVRRPVNMVQSNGEWTELTTWNFAGANRYCRLQGSTIEFYAALPSAGSVTLAYVSKNWKAASDLTSPGTSWDLEDDVSYLPGPLIELGIIWRWRRNKGLIYADRKAEYESRLARIAADDKPQRAVNFESRKRQARNPFDVPIPDYIPPVS